VVYCVHPGKTNSKPFQYQQETANVWRYDQIATTNYLKNI